MRSNSVHLGLVTLAWGALLGNSKPFTNPSTEFDLTRRVGPETVDNSQLNDCLVPQNVQKGLVGAFDPSFPPNRDPNVSMSYRGSPIAHQRTHSMPKDNVVLFMSKAQIWYARLPIAMCLANINAESCVLSSRCPMGLWPRNPFPCVL